MVTIMAQNSIDIVFPVLNEENRLPCGIDATIHFLEQHQEFDYLLTIADNGSTDATEEVAKELMKRYSGKIRYLKVGKKGVGLALRTAWTTSNKDIVGYMDVDLATDISHLLDVYRLFAQTNVDIVNGSRLLKGACVKKRSLLREVASRSLNLIVPVLLQTKFTDAMCGFKFLRRNVAQQLCEQSNKTDGWFFCAEILVKAEWQKMRIKEIPVRWTDDDDSRVNVMQLGIRYMREIIRLHRERASFLTRNA